MTLKLDETDQIYLRSSEWARRLAVESETPMTVLRPSETNQLKRLLFCSAEALHLLAGKLAQDERAELNLTILEIARLST